MIRNSNSAYGWLAIALHWLMALMIFGLFGLGLYMVELTYYDAWYKGSLDLHKSVGLVVALLLLLRIVWRWRNPAPAALPGPRWEQRAAHGAHLLLYGLMVLLVVSGYLISTADGRAIEVFGWVSVPALPWAVDKQEDIAGEIHEILAWSLMALVALHLLAALKHHFINKDRTLTRMLKAD